MSPDSKSIDNLESYLAKTEAAYVQPFPTSSSHCERALGLMPGGNTRSVLFNEPFPISMVKGDANRL